MNRVPEGHPGHKAFTAEAVARALLLICAVAAIFAVCAITFYMFAKGLPALGKVGVTELLFGTITSLFSSSDIDFLRTFYRQTEQFCTVVDHLYKP